MFQHFENVVQVIYIHRYFSLVYSYEKVPSIFTTARRDPLENKYSKDIFNNYLFNIGYLLTNLM